MNTREAKTRLYELLAAVEKRGELVIVSRAGRPVAEIRALRPRRNAFRKDPRLSKIVFREDPAAPLDADD